MLRSYKGVKPRVGQRVYVDPSAQVIGDVELGDHASVWMNAVVRGDVHSIRIGPHSNIQDNCVVHVTAEHRTELAEDVTVGHSVTLHGCRIGSRSLIGIGAIVLNGAEVGEESVVAAGTLVPEGMKIPAGSLVMGLPGKVRRPITDEERRRVASVQGLRRNCRPPTRRPTSRNRRGLRPRRRRALDPRRHGDAGHPARGGVRRGTASRGPRARSSRSTATARSAPPSSRRRTSSRAASGPGDRHRVEGDVHVRGPRRRVADAAARRPRPASCARSSSTT